MNYSIKILKLKELQNLHLIINHQGILQRNINNHLG